MNSSKYRLELDRIKGLVIQECKRAIESIAQKKYSLELGYKQIILIFPLWDQGLNTPIYVNSCFDGENNILIRMVKCDSEGISIGCHYIDEEHSWRADIADVCMHVRDMIDILELVEKMECMENVYDYLHVRF